MELDSPAACNGAEENPCSLEQRLTSSFALQIFTQAATGAELYLALPLTDIRNSLVVVTVNAASLTLVMNESPARITSAEAGTSLHRLLDLTITTICP